MQAGGCIMGDVRLTPSTKGASCPLPMDVCLSKIEGTRARFVGGRKESPEDASEDGVDDCGTSNIKKS